MPVIAQFLICVSANDNNTLFDTLAHNEQLYNAEIVLVGAVFVADARDVCRKDCPKQVWIGS